MHGLPFWTLVARSHAYLRSARSLLPRLLESARDGHPCPVSAPFLELPRIGAPSPRACARSPTSDCWYQY
eukprot:6174828-Pleurochrysis_carterae.AAC.1